MFYSDPKLPARIAELDPVWHVVAIHRNAEARRDRSFWRIYAGDALLGSGVTKKVAWLAAWKNVRPKEMEV